MKPFWRQLSVIILGVAFFVTVPLVLLATAGYRYNNKRHRVEMTGIIEARSVPSGATVWLNGVAQDKTTPLTVSRLLSEDYVVRLTKDGYLPWEKNLSVEAGQTAFTTSVVLLRDSLPRLLIAGRFTATAWTANGKRLAFIRTMDGYREVGVWSVTSGLTTLARLGAADGEDQDAVVWSPDEGKLLVTAQTPSGTSVVCYYPGTARRPASLDTFLPHGPLTAKWASDSQHVIVVGTSGAFSVQADGAEATPLAVGTGILDAAVRDRLALIIRRNAAGDVFLEKTETATKPQPLTKLPDASCRFADWRGVNLLIADGRRGHLLVVDPDGNLLQEINGTNYAVAKNGAVVLWNSFEVYLGDLTTGQTSLVTRLSTPIGNCAWHPNGTHVICTAASFIFAAETDNRDRRNSWELVRASDLGAVAVDDLGPVIRFTATIGQVSGLYVRDL